MCPLLTMNKYLPAGMTLLQWTNFCSKLIKKIQEQHQRNLYSVICCANQLTGFYMRATPALNRLIINLIFLLLILSAFWEQSVFYYLDMYWRPSIDYPANGYLLKFNNRKTRKRYEIYSKLTTTTPERSRLRRSSVFIGNFFSIFFFWKFLSFFLS